MNTKRLAKIFKALSNPNRLELFLEILEKHKASFETGHECFISDIMDSLAIGAPTVSHHLKELSNAELIVTERRGKFVVARIDEETVAEAGEALMVRDTE